MLSCGDVLRPTRSSTLASRTMMYGQRGALAKHSIAFLWCVLSIAAEPATATGT
jgi:hypothetical protein